MASPYGVFGGPSTDDWKDTVRMAGTKAEAESRVTGSTSKRNYVGRDDV